MGSYYKQIAARFRRQAAEAQREKSVVDGKISRLRKASSSLASERQSAIASYYHQARVYEYMED